MNKSMILKVFAIIGIIITFAHLTYYFLRPYSFLWFMVGFGVIYVVFILGLKQIKKMFD